MLHRGGSDLVPGMSKLAVVPTPAMAPHVVTAHLGTVMLVVVVLGLRLAAVGRVGC